MEIRVKKAIEQSTKILMDHFSLILDMASDMSHTEIEEVIEEKPKKSTKKSKKAE